MLVTIDKDLAEHIEAMAANNGVSAEAIVNDLIAKGIDAERAFFSKQKSGEGR